MTNHETIKTAIAEAVAASDDVRAYCVENFGRGALVIVNWFGANGAPSEADSPFVFITSHNDENDAGMVDEETYVVDVVVAGTDNAEMPTVTESIERTDAANGLVVNGIAAKLETLRNMIEDIIKAGAFGAAARTFIRTESSVSDYPLEWAKVKVEFFEPETI